MHAKETSFFFLSLVRDVGALVCQMKQGTYGFVGTFPEAYESSGTEERKT